jgi:organic hydroperoxide reductase OsmC/OhrA
MLELPAGNQATGAVPCRAWHTLGHPEAADTPGPSSFHLNDPPETLAALGRVSLELHESIEVIGGQGDARPAQCRDGGCAALAHPLYKGMSEHKVTLRWERGGAEFSYQKYPRDHTWSFDGGHTMTATAAPAYLGNPANVDPEEAFVASLSSCHMLTFLAIACKQKFVLESYEDEAIGHMEKNAEGKMAITRVELRPRLTWTGERIPSAAELDKMHHAAHENCFIANSVRTEVSVV